MGCIELMSIVLGVYIHVQQGRHRLVWTLLEGNSIIDQGDLGAPTAPESERLAELEVRFADLLKRLLGGARPPAFIALRVHDLHGGGTRPAQAGSSSQSSC